MSSQTKTWVCGMSHPQAQIAGAWYGYQLTSSEVRVEIQLSQRQDSDFDLRLTIVSADLAHSGWFSTRIREPYNGGGNMRVAYSAFGQLLRALQTFAANPMLDLPHVYPAAHPLPWVWRHLDERVGHIGLMVDDQGQILLALVPLTDEETLHDRGLCLGFSHTETPAVLYQALLGLYVKLDLDNTARPHDTGNHA